MKFCNNCFQKVKSCLNHTWSESMWDHEANHCDMCGLYKTAFIEFFHEDFNVVELVRLVIRLQKEQQHGE